MYDKTNDCLIGTFNCNFHLITILENLIQKNPSGLVNQAFLSIAIMNLALSHDPWVTRWGTLLLIEIMGRHVYANGHTLARLEDLLNRIGRPDISYLAYMAVGYAHRAHQRELEGKCVVPNDDEDTPVDDAFSHMELSAENLAWIQIKLLPDNVQWMGWIESVYSAAMDYDLNPYQDPASEDEHQLAKAISVFAHALTVNEELIAPLQETISVQEFVLLSQQAQPFAAQAVTSDTLSPDYCFERAQHYQSLAMAAGWSAGCLFPYF